MPSGKIDFQSTFVIPFISYNFAFVDKSAYVPLLKYDLF